MTYLRGLGKFAVVAVTLVVLTPSLHEVLTLVFPWESGITGEPIIPRLLVAICIQVALMLVVFKTIREDLPATRGWSRGLVFGALFLLSVQIPSVFGIIAFEAGADWQWLTEAKLANYRTVVGDCVVWLVVGALMGALFSGDREGSERAPGIPWVACGVGAVVFPTGLWAVMHGSFAVLPISDPNAPVGRSLYFDLVFYGVFFLTGAVLPYLHRRFRRGRGVREVLRTAGLFALLWLPVQNFMVVFGWQVGGAVIFSLLSTVPVVLVVWLADRIDTRA